MARNDLPEDRQIREEKVRETRRNMTTWINVILVLLV
jgi:hypothetical protein